MGDAATRRRAVSDALLGDGLGRWGTEREVKYCPSARMPRPNCELCTSLSKNIRNRAASRSRHRLRMRVYLCFQLRPCSLPLCLEPHDFFGMISALRLQLVLEQLLACLPAPPLARHVAM